MLLFQFVKKTRKAPLMAIVTLVIKPETKSILQNMIWRITFGTLARSALTGHLERPTKNKRDNRVFYKGLGETFSEASVMYTSALSIAGCLSSTRPKSTVLFSDTR